MDVTQNSSAEAGSPWEGLVQQDVTWFMGTRDFMWAYIYCIPLSKREAEAGLQGALPRPWRAVSSPELCSSGVQPAECQLPPPGSYSSTTGRETLLCRRKVAQ